MREPTAVSLPLELDVKSIVLVVDFAPAPGETRGLPDAFAIDAAAGDARQIAFHFDPRLGVELRALEYRAPLEELGLAPGSIAIADPTSACRALPAPDFAFERALPSTGSAWQPAPIGDALPKLDLGCLHCPMGQHDGGRGTCVAATTCADGFHDGGDGTCLSVDPFQCSPCCHDDGDGACSPKPLCAHGFHDGGGQICVRLGACLDGFHDGGGGDCVELGACSSGFFLDDELGCTPIDRCRADGLHDGGDGGCTAIGDCSPGFNVDARGVCYRFRTVARIQLPREAHSATRLEDGRVLVAGGDCGSAFRPSTELYDPALDAWSFGPEMSFARSGQAAELLTTGEVLVFDGYAENTLDPGVEVLDAALTSWSTLPSSEVHRFGHRSAVLRNGVVMIPGGTVKDPRSRTLPNISDVQAFDPRTHRTTPLPRLGEARGGAAASLLFDGRVLVSGGFTSTSTVGKIHGAELYDPAAGRWTFTSSMSAVISNHTQTVLRDGRVLVAGGSATEPIAQLYDPRRDVWRPTRSRPHVARAFHTATLLRDGRVLIVDGGAAEIYASAEIFDPRDESWALLDPGPLFPRSVQTATPLQDGRILIAGGITTVVRCEEFTAVEVYESGL